MGELGLPSLAVSVAGTIVVHVRVPVTVDVGIPITGVRVPITVEVHVAGIRVPISVGVHITGVRVPASQKKPAKCGPFFHFL